MLHSDDEILLARLREMYPLNKANRCFGFYINVKNMGFRAAKELISANAYYDYFHMLKDAGSPIDPNMDDK